MATTQKCKNGTWLIKFYYKDREGKRKQKLKRGFKTKKEALQFEQEFKLEQENAVKLPFSHFCELYIKGQSVTWKGTTRKTKVNKINNWLVPFFGTQPLDEIKPIDVKNWQNWLVENNLSPTTQKNLNSILSSIFNYAKNFYGLKENPCHKAPSIGSYKREKVEFWTLEEFEQFLSCIENPSYRLAYKTLFYTGLRIGELQALTPADFDFSVPKLTVSRNYQVIEGKGVFITPKTEKSRRDVILPEKLAEEIQEYIKQVHGLGENDRIFHYSVYQYGKVLKKTCKENNLKSIRLHDLRHSHASLLIDRGYNIALISERLGHGNISTTLNIYGHLYPSQQYKLAKDLNKIIQ